MPSHNLTGFIGLKVGPLVLETLVKHYLERIRTPSKEGASISLRQEELLYDQAFNVVKAFLATATKNTVEDLQEFSNTRTPSPPWVRIVRLNVPMSCCDKAAEYLITALGGEEVANKVVGGTKWWQVRGLKGIPAEWMTAKKDLQHAKAHRKTGSKEKEHFSTEESANSDSDEGTYDPDMDEQRCIFYLHGGGYYFGSVDLERYSIQRFARKIKGRVFAVNYRLSPQYPFPCAIQDAVASYLYLIRPPPGALHQPVNPKHIIIMGDSAGGGLSLALLQVIRDSGLPAPASGVLVSPWCDMSHSFPSIHENTDSDVIPYYGLSLHKPSTLWPPPPEGITNKVHETLKNRIRGVVRMDANGRLKRSLQKEDDDKRSIASVNVFSPHPAPELPIDLGTTMRPPNVAAGDSQKFTLKTGGVEVMTVDTQIQLYAPNNLLAHPLIGHVGAYLGGLPPLFFIAGDKEVLRDEIIYVAHKAAHPERFPLKNEAKNLCPTLNDIESRYGPTQVHLQVYDDCAHILPVLFPFTTPAKFCFRAIAGFCKYTTGMLNDPDSPTKSRLPYISMPLPEHLISDSLTESPSEDPQMLFRNKSFMSVRKNETSKEFVNGDKQIFGTTKSAKMLDAKSPSSRFRTRSQPNLKQQRDATDVGGPRFHHAEPQDDNERYAGNDPSMYLEPFEMIRERVSIRGIIRPLESEQELGAFQIEPKAVGAISELSLRRYVTGKKKFDEKFASTMKTIQREREKNFELAKKEGKKTMSQLQAYLMKAEESEERASGEEEREVSGSWNWAWALDENERPPPSSIASRRDTHEARRLAKIADLMPETVTSGNSLWSHLVNFLTVAPDRNGTNEDSDKGGKEDSPVILTSSNGRTWPRSKHMFWRDKSK